MNPEQIERDVIVVGGGNAALAAGLAAHEAGAEVVVLEAAHAARRGEQADGQLEAEPQSVVEA